MTLVPSRQATAPTSTLHKVRHGIYSTQIPSGPRQKHYMQTLAALQSRRGPHVVSHVSAAAAHQLPLFNADFSHVHLTTPDPWRRGRRTGVHIHQGATDDAVEIGGVLVTPLARTLLGCARTMPREQAVAMMDYALHENLVTKEDLLRGIHQLSRWRVERVREVVDLAGGRAESVGESRSRLILLDAGFSVTPQVWARDENGVAFARIDLVIDGLRLGFEFEGREKAVLAGDSGGSNKERNDLVEDRYWILVPVYWEHCEHPQILLSKVYRGLRRLRTLEGL